MPRRLILKPTRPNFVPKPEGKLGDPEIRNKIREWSSQGMSQLKIVAKLKEECGISVSQPTISTLLRNISWKEKNKTQ
jgi:hypothetical protein